MQALGLDDRQRFAQALKEYMQRKGERKSTRAVRTAVNRYLDGSSSEMSTYELWIRDLANSRGLNLPEGWSKNEFGIEQLREDIFHQKDFPLSFSHSDDRFAEACRMLFAENKTSAVFRITRPSFDVDHGITTELAYLWAEQGDGRNRILFHYYFTSTVDTSPGHAAGNGVIEVPIAKKDIHRGSGAVQRFGNGHLWVGHNTVDGHGLIDRGRLFYFGPKNSRAADRHTHAGLVLSQRKSRGNNPRCVTCIAQRCDDISFKNGEKARAKDVRENTTLRVLANDTARDDIPEFFHAQTEGDRRLLWDALRGESPAMNGVLEIDSDLTDLSSSARR